MVLDISAGRGRGPRIIDFNQPPPVARVDGESPWTCRPYRNKGWGVLDIMCRDGKVRRFV